MHIMFNFYFISFSLNTDFIAWRGHFTKFLITPYQTREPWKMAVTKFKGTIYISEVETEKSRQERVNRSPIHQEMCYWGYKFEDYMTKSINGGMFFFQHSFSVFLLILRYISVSFVIIFAK